MKILFTPFSLPAPPVIGGPQRTNLLLRALRRLGAVDTIGLSRSQFTDEFKAELAERYNVRAVLRPTDRGAYMPWGLARPLAPRLVDRLAHNFGRRRVDYRPDPAITRWFDQHVDLDQYDVVVGRYLYGLTKPDLIDRARTVLDVDDLDTEVYRTRLAVPTNRPWQNMMIRHHLRQLNRVIPPLLRRCDALWVANENDRQRHGLADADVLPNIPFIPEGATTPHAFPADPESKTILIVGSMSHRPNVEGVDWFVEHAWPLVRRDVPEAKLEIVGAKSTPRQIERWSASPGVQALGFVESLDDVYQRCAFTVAPIFAGGGTNIKVLESLARGRTSVLARPAHRGYENTLLDEHALLVGDDAESIAAACVRLLRDPELRQKLADHGRHIAETTYSFEHFAKVVETTIQRVVSA